MQLIDATSFWAPMRRSLGDKRREISAEQIATATGIYERFEESEHSKIFDTTDFSYRKITVERPLRLNFHVSPERIDRLRTEAAFQALAVSKKKAAKERAQEEAKGRQLQERLVTALQKLPTVPVKDRQQFVAMLESAKTEGLKLTAALRKAILSALGERDETAAICLDDEGHPEPDPELRDTESVPLKEDIDAYFAREVAPHVPDAWINLAVRDKKDSEVGKVGYEINFNRCFYKYTPARPLEEIERDVRLVETEILEMLRDIGG